MTPEEIASEQDLDIVSVKAILMQFSGLYREQCKVKEDLNFTDEEEVAARGVITNIARYSEDERLRLRAAIYIRDDKKGRLDVVRQMNGLNINVIHFNDQMKKAIAAKERAKAIINVSAQDSSVKQLVEENS